MIKSAEEFHRLRTSSKSEEYGRAANEPSDETVWLDVTKRYPDMRFWVAQNKTVPLSILKLLASDDDGHVRSMVAAKRKLDLDTFALLARDADAGVRHQVACNAKTPSDVLRDLSQDEEPFVASAALEGLAAKGR